MTLTRSQAEAYYDRFGKKQDTQAFYEDAAVDDLVGHAAFAMAGSVLEFGCGTGRLASRLLAEYLSPSTTYLGIDISRTMVELAARRIESYGERAKVIRTDGSIGFPAADRSIDRVVSTYVLDLLSKADMQRVLTESARVLTPDGKLCLVSLTIGPTPLSTLVSRLWSRVFRWRPALVGGCRPIRLEAILGEEHWSIEYQNVVVKWGVPSEVVIARPVRILT